MRLGSKQISIKLKMKYRWERGGMVPFQPWYQPINSMKLGLAKIYENIDWFKRWTSDQPMLFSKWSQFVNSVGIKMLSVANVGKKILPEASMGKSFYTSYHPKFLGKYAPIHSQRGKKDPTCSQRGKKFLHMCSANVVGEMRSNQSTTAFHKLKSYKGMYF